MRMRNANSSAANGAEHKSEFELDLIEVDGMKYENREKDVAESDTEMFLSNLNNVNEMRFN